MAELKDEQTPPAAQPNSPLSDGGTKPADSSRPGGAAAGSAAPAAPAFMPDLSAEVLGQTGQSIDLLGDVELNVKVELGRCHMPVEEVLRLAEGSVVELDKLAGDPVDVLVNERLVARGEVLVLNDTFCVRVNEIVTNDVSAN